MLLLTLVVHLLLDQITSNDADRVLEDRSESIVAGIDASSPGVRPDVPDSVLDAGVAVFDSSGVLVAGDAPGRLQSAYEALSTATTVQARTLEDEIRVRAEPFTTTGGASGVVVVASDLDPYEEAERLALIVTLLIGVLATGASAAIAAWSTTRALRPVAEMSRTAADWSEHDLTRRFALGPSGNEITALARTLDQLLDKVGAAIRSEQRLTAELAHELRTPLTVIQGTADLVLLRDGPALPAAAHEDLVEISAAGRRMAATITTLLDLARSEATTDPGASSDLAAVLDDLMDAVAPTPSGDVTVTMSEPPRAQLALPPEMAARALTPVIENAVRHARARVELTARVEGRGVEIVVTDDGPGVDPALVDSLFEPGRTSGERGTGLGLAIARRVSRAAGGDVELIDAGSAGARRGASFAVRLPVV